MNSNPYLRFNTNVDKTLRHRVGSFLRLLATRIDGRGSVAMEFDCWPALPITDVQERVQSGLDRIYELLVEAWHARCSEAVMRVRHPELFEDQPK